MTSSQTVEKPATHRRHLEHGHPAMDTPPLEDALAETISETAYYLAEARGFEPGHEVEDWLEAEKQVVKKYEGMGRATWV